MTEANLENRRLHRLWLLLMALTLLGAWVAETAEPAIWVSLVVALMLGFKGKMVVEHFMGMRCANRYLRKAMNIYFWVIPVMIVIVQLFPGFIARITRLE